MSLRLKLLIDAAASSKMPSAEKCSFDSSSPALAARSKRSGAIEGCPISEYMPVNSLSISPSAVSTICRIERNG